MSAVPPPVNSPLGSDPTPPVQQTPPATPPAPPVVNTPPPPSGKNLTQAEYDVLQAKASHFDAIAGDPVIAEKVVDHFRSRGRVQQPPVANPPAGAPPQAEPPQVDTRMQQKMDAMTQRLAQLEVEAFRAKHPDMDQFKDDMVPLMHRGIPLEDAYRFSKAVKAQTTQNPVKPVPVTATTETNRTAGIDDDPDNLSAIEQKISDPKATPRLDDAIALAWQAAKKKVGS